MVRLFSAAMALAVGLLVLLLADLALGAAPVSAQGEVERKNCPPGFHWERMSGQCCVQDHETLPANGKIGYTGNSLCGEGYVGVYEQRPITDGQGPPGCPNYTSFAFLTSCVTPEEYAALEAAGQLPGQATEGPGGETTEQPGAGPGAAIGGGGGGIGGVARDAAETLFGGGSGPSPGDLAAAGLGMAAVGVLIGLGTFVLGSPVAGSTLAGGGAWTQAVSQIPKELVELDEKEAKEAKVREADDALGELEKALRRKVDTTAEDWAAEVIDLIGLAASAVGLAGAEEAARALSFGKDVAHLDDAAGATGSLAAMASMFSNVQGMTAEEIVESRRQLLAQVSFLRGATAAELEDLQAQKQKLENPPPQELPSAPPTPWVPLEKLTAADLDAQIAEADKRVRQARAASHSCEQNLWNLIPQKSDMDARIGDMRRRLDSMDLSVGWDVAGKSATPTGAVAAVAGALIPGVGTLAAVAALFAGGVSYTASQQKTELNKARLDLLDRLRRAEFNRGKISNRIGKLQTRCAGLKQTLADAEKHKAMLRDEQGRRAFYD